MNSDEFYMRRCLELAELGKGHTSPNPLVGCVIVHNDEIIGEGHHRAIGEAHAEVNAIASVENEELLPASTVYVNLEPCAHFGKTPPCANLLVSKGVERVVIAQKDPNPKVAGKGIQILKEAGIQVSCGTCEKEAKELNRRFNTWFEKNRPYFILKWAESKDGYMDRPRLENERGSFPISSPESRKLVHLWRSQEDGILVGAGTANTDDPSLNVREIEGRSPLRIVLDLEGTLKNDLKLLTDGEATLVFTSSVEVKGAESVSITESTSLKTLSETLFQKGIQSILVEGGRQVHESFLKAGLWDEIRVIQSDRLLQDGLPAPTPQHEPEKEFSFGNDRISIYRKL